MLEDSTKDVAADSVAGMLTDEPIDAAELTALMCAHLCHELISPMAAVGNALEMLEDPTASVMHDDARELLHTSAESSWARLELFRIAFGAGGSAPGRIELAEIRGVVMKRYGDGKFRFDWRVRAESLDKLAARVLLNLIILTAFSLPRGGDLVVSADANGENVKVSGQGRMRRVSDDVVACLRGEAPAGGFEARTIQPYYAGLLARCAGGSADVSLEGEGVEFFATLAAAGGRNAA